MHPKIATGRVAIYARYSSELQSEASIDDQVRRARDVIAREGGDPMRAEVFSDYAVSGSSMARAGLEKLMAAVERGKVDIVLTEDISRLSRDMGDAAMIFKRLQFHCVPLIGLSDGIDTSHKHAKLSFAVKSLLADMYIDDLRDKTLRGLEGRALAGFATGQVPFGYRLVKQTDKFGRSTSKIEIHEANARLIRRIFDEYRSGGALNAIVRRLNLEHIPSPRLKAKTRHRRFGWGVSTIRAMLMNERYAGVWRFKEKQWVKVPGTNRRLPRKRSPEEVITTERPDLRIIDEQTWQEVKTRLAAVHRLYRGAPDERKGAKPRGKFLLSGIVFCDECGGPLSICGSQTSYYHCSTRATKGTCGNTLRIKERDLREECLGAIRSQLQNEAGLAHVHAEVTKRMQERAAEIATELRDRRAALKDLEQQVAKLVAFVAAGKETHGIVASLRELEGKAADARAEVERLEEESAAELPPLETITAAVFRMDALLKAPTDIARGRLRSWLENGQIRVAKTKDGSVSSGVVLPLTLLHTAESENPESFRDSGDSNLSVSSGGWI